MKILNEWSGKHEKSALAYANVPKPPPVQRMSSLTYLFISIYLYIFFMPKLIFL